MALQGTLDTFAFADVLRLLANTGKSGRLELDGDRGAGRLWFGEGDLVGGQAPDDTRALELADVVFQMLRFEDGSFRFDANDLPESPEGPFAVDEVIGQAEAKLAEWREIEVVVPSLSSRLSLTPELEVGEGEQISLDPSEWRLVAAVGGEVAVRELGDRLSIADLALCRTVKDLVERGLLVVGETSEPPPPDPDVVEPLAELDDAGDDGEMPAEEIDGQDYFADGSGSHSARTRLDVMAASFGGEGANANQAILPEPLPADVALADGDPDGPDPSPSPVQDQPAAQTGIEELPAPPAPEAETDPEWTDEDDEQVEMNRQLAGLSPRAAEAIATAASSLKGEDLHAGRNRLRTRSSSLRR